MGEILIGARRYDDALRMHTRQQEIAHALSVADPTNSELQTIEAYALLGIATVLSKQGSVQEALTKQTWAMETLRVLFDADAKDTEARYNAAFALSEVSETLITLGQLQAAEHNLRDALAILEPSAAGTPSLDRDRLLQGLDYFRLGQIKARQADDPKASRAQRANLCEEARRWFEQSTPILDAADNRAAQVAKLLSACGQPRIA
jgi:tetratricopeptide (TPR) repeat protein